MNEKIVSCSYSKCNSRRLHFERPEFNRSKQVFCVPKDHPGPLVLFNRVYDVSPGREAYSRSIQPLSDRPRVALPYSARNDSTASCELVKTV
jgi:hypothetical protein